MSNFFCIIVLLFSIPAFSGQGAARQDGGVVLDMLLGNGDLINTESVAIEVSTDRITIINEEMAEALKQTVDLPESHQGVALTKTEFVFFKSTGNTYVLLRGWDMDGNCKLVALRLQKNQLNLVPFEVENYCSGSPCSYCKFTDGAGCECKGIAPAGETGFCNHSTGPGRE